MNRERAIDIARKCMNLSQNNPSAEEAQTAFLKAQQLMVEYNISLGEVEESAVEIRVIHADLTDFARTPYWKKSLAVIISENFRCMAYTSTVGGYGRSKIKLIGLEGEVVLVKELFDFACNVLEYSVKKYTKIHGSSVKNDYIIGFVNGLKAKFKEQVDKNNWGLVLVKDALVVREIDKMNFRAGQKSTVQRSHSKDAYNEGYSRGKSLSKDKELTGR
jgi:hypothetical protein